jgi:hypothetical protein
VEVERVNAAVDRHSFACVRGLFSKQEMKAACKRVAENFSSKNDRPAIGDTGRDVMNNYQKLAVGGAMTSWDYRPRFYRIFYTPLWASDVFGVHDIFRRFARLRNRLQGYPPNFAIDTVDEGLWTAARMQHYPAGGGFFMAHRDVVIDTVTHDAGQRRFHQLLLLMTTKGGLKRDGFVSIRARTASRKTTNTLFHNGDDPWSRHDPHAAPTGWTGVWRWPRSTRICPRTKSPMRAMRIARRRRFRWRKQQAERR